MDDPETPRLPRASVPPWQAAWDRIPPLPPLVLSDGGGPALQATAVRVAWDREGLHVRFDCEDRDAWGTFTRRDEPIYQEEAVEVFLAPGEADPAVYFEFEVSPRGVLWDGVVRNPHSRRSDMTVDPGWDCPGIRWAAGPAGMGDDWWAELVLPWSGLLPGETGPPPRLWRANFYRIERPRGGEAEFSAWSPTLASPPDFHKPGRFGTLELAGPGGGSSR